MYIEIYHVCIQKTYYETTTLYTLVSLAWGGSDSLDEILVSPPLCLVTEATQRTTALIWYVSIKEIMIIHAQTIAIVLLYMYLMIVMWSNYFLAHWLQEIYDNQMAS